jgi:hypothetical protein
MKVFKACLILLLIVCGFSVFAQAQKMWYVDMPENAVWSSDKKSMVIGREAYPVYNAYDPIAPRGGLRIIDFAGVLDYYMWYHKMPNGEFAVSWIDLDLNIYYLDPVTNKYTSPKGMVFKGFSSSTKGE